MNRPVRVLWGLTAVGAAIAVGVVTHDAGFTAITLLGGLALPRILGIGGRAHGHRGWGGGCASAHPGRSRMEERLAGWHRQAHGEVDQAPGAPAAQSAVQV
jgi:hypothetical protein